MVRTIFTPPTGSSRADGGLPGGLQQNGHPVALVAGRELEEGLGGHGARLPAAVLELGVGHQHRLGVQAPAGGGGYFSDAGGAQRRADVLGAVRGQALAGGAGERGHEMGHGGRLRGGEGVLGHAHGGHAATQRSQRRGRAARSSKYQMQWASTAASHEPALDARKATGSARCQAMRAPTPLVDRWACAWASVNGLPYDPGAGSTASTRPDGPTASASTAVHDPCPQPSSSTRRPGPVGRPRVDQADAVGRLRRLDVREPDRPRQVRRDAAGSRLPGVSPPSSGAVVEEAMEGLDG